MNDLEHHIHQQLIATEGLSRGLTRWFYHAQDGKLLKVVDRMMIILEEVRPDIERMMRNGVSKQGGLYQGDDMAVE